jgi:excisionase family DNA binding protein
MPSTINSHQPASHPAPGKLLHVTHVAERLGISARSVRHKAEIGELPGFKLGPKLWRFKERDIEEYIERQRSRYLGLE